MKKTIVDYRYFINSNRYDADYFKQEYLELEKLLSKLNPKEKYILSDIAYIDYGYMPLEDYTTEELGIPFIRVTNIIGDLIIEMDDVKYVPKDNERVKGKTVQAEDILLVQCGSTTGKIGFVTKELEGYLFPSFCLVIRADRKKINPYYLGVLMNSKIIQDQIFRSMASASVRPNTTKPDIEKLVIPKIDENSQLDIEQTIRKAFDIRKESRMLIEDSRKFLEGSISGKKK